MSKPNEPKDLFEIGALAGINTPAPPSPGGTGTRQSRVPSGRRAISKRQMLCWLVPEQPIIQMYINPDQLIIKYNKQIQKQRTKGGFSIQYWGEDLIEITGSGTTGTSGIEGVNVLVDVYRNEQLMFDPYALFMQAEKDRVDSIETNSEIIDLIDGDFTGIGDALLGKGQAPITKTTSRPSLAMLATGVEMYWMGEVYRGYFNNFSFIESAQSLGLFTYNFSFTATQKRGIRSNYLAWHKSPNHGPSDSSSFGPPHSFSTLIQQDATTTRNNIDQPNLYQPFIDPGQQGLNSEPLKKYSDAAESLGEDIIDAFKL